MMKTTWFSVLISAMVLIFPATAIAQDSPARIGWAPSYSGACSGCDMSGRDLAGWNISNGDYSGSLITGASFRSVVASRTNFDNTRTRLADMRQGIFTNASFRSADLQAAKFDGSDMNGADFTGAKLNNADLSQVTLIGAIFVGSQMRNIVAGAADFSGAHFRNCDLSNARMEQTTFNNTRFDNVSFNGANIKGASFKSARFFNSDLERVEGIQAANFTDACSDAATRLPPSLILAECSTR